MSQGTEVSIMTRLWVCQPKKFVLIPGSSQGFFSSKHPHQPWDLPILLFRGYQELFTQRQSCWSMKLTTYLNLVVMLRMKGGCTSATPYTLMACTGRTLPLLHTSNSSASIM